VVGRLIAPDAPEPEEAEEEVEPDEKMKEVFEHFRSSIEDEF
jgi:hypothetical protein